MNGAERYFLRATARRIAYRAITNPYRERRMWIIPDDDDDDFDPFEEHRNYGIASALIRMALLTAFLLLLVLAVLH
jgi:hypothetical protein